MKTLDQLSSRELEIELLKRAIVRADEQMRTLSIHHEILLRKQRGRIRELAIQETLLQHSGTPTLHPAAARELRETVARMRE